MTVTTNSVILQRCKERKTDMAKNIHVHLHNPAPARTRDGDGEGKWVTINGAHVQIGEGGKITKGPAALVGKSEHDAHAEHHEAKADEHRTAAKLKGKDHADHKLHKKIAEAHAMAGRQFRNVEHAANSGNMVESGASARAGHTEAKKAEQHTQKLAEQQDATKAQKPKVPEYPAKHQALHSDAEDDITGSEKHKAEHNRLLNLYHSSEHDWQREAANRLIAKNATDAVQSKAQRLHNMALSASERAKASGDYADHRFASQHIQNAIVAHGKAGGAGYAAKQAELQKAKKVHDTEVAKGDKAAAKAGGGDDRNNPKGQALNHAEAWSRHTDKAKALKGMNDHRAAAKHEEAARLHDQARSAHVDGDKTAPGKTAAANRATRELEGTPLAKRTTPIAGDQRHDFTKAHKASAGQLDAPVIKGVKKAAEEAADQDPKHKK